MNDVRVLHFRNATVRVHSNHVETTFNGTGRVSRFFPPVGQPAFDAAARYAGYADSLRFGLEHDILHHAVSDQVGWARSPVVWWNACGEPDDPQTKELRDLEEHLVVRLQRYINTGEMDEEYGLLRQYFGEELAAFATSALLLCRPWLAIEPLLDWETKLPDLGRVRQKERAPY